MSLPFGRRSGRKLVIHPMWLAAGCLALAGDWLPEWLLLQGLVLFHESGHAIAARRCKWNIGHLHLTAIGAMIELDPGRRGNEISEMIVALAGPFTHLFWIGTGRMLTTCMDGSGVLPAWFFTVQESRILFEWISWLEQANWTMLWFNLLPLWPLDGGRIMMAYMKERMDPQTVYRMLFGIGIAAGGLVLTIMLFSFPAYFTWNGLFIGLFLIEQNRAAWKNIRWFKLRDQFKPNDS